MRETAGSFICICHCQLRGRGGRDHFQDPLPFIPLIPLLRLFRHPSLPPRDEFRRDAIVSSNDRGYRGKLIHWSILSIFFFFSFSFYQLRIASGHPFCSNDKRKTNFVTKIKGSRFLFFEAKPYSFFPSCFFSIFFFFFLPLIDDKTKLLLVESSRGRGGRVTSSFLRLCR